MVFLVLPHQTQESGQPISPGTVPKKARAKNKPRLYPGLKPFETQVPTFILNNKRWGKKLVVIEKIFTD
jgi:hypothetical protein